MIYDEPEDTLPEDIDFGSDEEAKEPEVIAPVAKEPEPEKAKPPSDVPYKRFQEVVQERNSVRDALAQKDREIAELRAKTEKPEPQQPDATLAEKIRAQHAALLQGDEEEAERLGLELEAIREEKAINSALARIEAKATAAAMKAQESEADAAARELVNTYPALNHESDAFDSDLHAEVCALADSYAKTMTVAAALKKAATRLIGGAPEPAPKPGNSKAYENAQIAAKIPPSLSAAGRSNANASVDQFSTQAVRKMSDEAFKKLSEEERDVLLGNA